MMEGQGPHFVSAAEITRNFGVWQDRAAQGPLVVTHHGRPRCVMLSADAYEALAGRPAGADAEAERSAIAHALLAERIDAGFLVVDRHGRVSEANTLAASLLGRARGHLVGHLLGEAAPALAEGLAGSALRRVLRSGEEARLLLPATGAREADWMLHAFPWPGGAALIFRAAGADQQADTLLAEADARDRAIAAHGGIAVARLSLRATIAHAGDGLAAMTGFTPERLAGVRFTDLLALSCRAAAGAAIERALTGGPPAAIDSRLLVDGGTEHPVRLALAPVGEGVGVAGAIAVMTAAVAA